MLLDATPACLETSARGIGRHVAGLLPAVQNALERSGFEVLEASLRGSPSLLDGIQRVELGSARFLRFLAPWQRQVLASGLLGRAARRHHCSALLGTETSLFPPTIPGVRIGLMLYDLIPLVDPARYVDTYKRGNQWMWKRRLPDRWRAADLVFASTHEAARTARELIGLSDATLRVIPPGVDHGGIREPPSDSGIDAPFFLCVGAIEERKNVERLVHAFARADIPGHRLVFAGPMAPFRMEMVRNWADAAGIRERIVLTGRVGDGVLQALYRDCTAFLFPSLLEGFGLPPLEAMLAKAPVLASRSSCMPEVLGDEVMWVDGLDVDSIAAGIRRLALDADFRARLSEAGPARAALYRWDESGRRMAEALVA